MLLGYFVEVENVVCPLLFLLFLIVNVYNPTTGNLGSDGWQTVMGNLGQRQTVQVAVEAQLGEALAYNAALAEARRLSVPIFTEAYGHSQGSVNMNYAMKEIDPDKLKQIRLFNFGTAANFLPAVGEYININDRNDPVPAGMRIMGGGWALNDSPLFKANPETYRSIETDFNSDGRQFGNNHSLYLYLQRDKVRTALGYAAATPNYPLPYTDYYR